MLHSKANFLDEFNIWTSKTTPGTVYTNVLSLASFSALFPTSRCAYRWKHSIARLYLVTGAPTSSIERLLWKLVTIICLNKLHYCWPKLRVVASVIPTFRNTNSKAVCVTNQPSVNVWNTSRNLQWSVQIFFIIVAYIISLCIATVFHFRLLRTKFTKQSVGRMIMFAWAILYYGNSATPAGTSTSCPRCGCFCGSVVGCTWYHL